MKCPRCGTENMVPEVTQQRCFNCGFLLFGEAEEHHVLRRSARWAFLWQLILLLAIIGGLAAFAWSRNWFGLFERGQFNVSEKLNTTSLIGGGPIYLTVNQSPIPFSREATWNVDAILLGQQVYDDELASIAKRDLLIAWGPAATIRLNTIQGGLHDRTATVTVPEELIDDSQLQADIAIVHVVAGDPSIERLLGGAKPGALLSLSGYAIAGTLNGTAYPASTPPASGNQVGSWLVEVTYAMVNGKAATGS